MIKLTKNIEKKRQNNIKNVMKIIKFYLKIIHIGMGINTFKIGLNRFLAQDLNAFHLTWCKKMWMHILNLIICMKAEENRVTSSLTFKIEIWNTKFREPVIESLKISLIKPLLLLYSLLLYSHIIARMLKN